MMTPGSPNYKEMLMQAYLAGRGNTNVHIVTHGQSSLTTPSDNEAISNIVGPAYAATQRQRAMEAGNGMLPWHILLRYGTSHDGVDQLLTFLQADTGVQEFTTFDGEDGFHASTIIKNPDVLKRTKTKDVAARTQKWKDALEQMAMKSDMAHMIGAAYVAGMVSPAQTSRFMAVNKVMIEDVDNWLGKVRSFKDVASIKAPGKHASLDDPQRDALVFFAGLV